MQYFKHDKMIYDRIHQRLGERCPEKGPTSVQAVDLKGGEIWTFLNESTSRRRLLLNILKLSIHLCLLLKATHWS